MKSLFTLVTFVAFFAFNSAAQFQHSQNSPTTNDDTLACGFFATQNQINALESDQSFQQAKADFIATYGTKALNQIDWVPIKPHIVRTNAGTGGLTVTELNDAMTIMNDYYINANMQFYICNGINYIDDNTYYDFDATEEAAMHAAHGVNNLINIYFCNTVSSGASALCGYAYFPGGPDVILMANSCATNGSTLSHEMGHFYSLYHTHGTANGTLTDEFVNGSNCGTAGDRVCDTEADPQLGNANVNVSCIYDGSAPYTSGGGLDGNGDQFVPNPNNIMSYSRKACRDFFSVGQYARINAAHLTQRNYFTCPTFSVDFSATPTSSCTTPVTVNFTDNSTGATSWAWDVDGDNIVDYTTQNPSHIYTVAGAYDVRLTVSNGTDTIAETKLTYIAAGAVGSIPYNEDYETSTSATNATGLANGWTTNPENTTSAFRWNVDENGTPSNGTGPLVDNTLGTSVGHYMHVEASSGSANDVAELISPCIDLNAGAPQLSFAYHMHGTAIGELHLDIYSGGAWVNDIMTALVGQQTTNQNDAYSNQLVDLTTWSGEVVQFRFRAIRGSSWSGDITIDDINITCIGSTPTADFTANNTTPCAGETVVFTDASTNATGWTWDFGAGATPATATGVGPHNVVYSTGGNKTISLTANSGCSTDDTTKTNYLSVAASSSNSITASACNSYTSPSTNYTWTSTGIYADTLVNAVGCDSLLTIDLTINNATASTDNQVACESYTWPLNGNTYTSSTSSPTATLTNAAGCDSVVTLDLTINYSNTGIDVQSACGSYTWIDGNTYTSSNNTATFTLTNVTGCDSIVTLDLTINTPSAGTDIQNACGSYSWIDGNTYTSSNNTATFTLTNAAGCDSIVTLDLTINSSSTSTDTQAACDTYTWMDGNTYTSSNSSATYTLTNAAGCDSIVTLDLTITSSSTSTDTQVACDSYTWMDGNTYTSSNSSATYTLTNAAGCDSTVTLDLTINSSTTSTDTQTACDTYTWMDGNTYTSSNSSATYTLTNTAGCDSTVTLDLTVNYSTSNAITETGLDSVTVNGQTYSSSGTYTQVLTNAAGCDSVLTIDVELDFTGLDQQEIDQLTIVPNPATEYIKLVGVEQEMILSAAIIDANGKLVRNSGINNNQIDISTINAGTYFLEVTTESQTYRVRFVKQ